MLCPFDDRAIFDRLLTMFQQTVSNANASMANATNSSPTSVAQILRSPLFNKDIKMKPLTKKYDGSVEGLIPFPNHLDIH